MNSFLISAITLCLAAQVSLAQYQSYGANNGGYQQRKMAPSPQTYQQNGGSAYGGEQQSYESSGYGGEHSAAGYRAPSSASVSSYDERTPAAGYNKQAAGYGKQQANAGYGAAPAASYAKPTASYGAAPAARYEEPNYAPMPFAWGYDINDGYGGAQYHKENGDEYGKRTGSYGYTDAYGVYRQVDYVADEHGFRATIKTNEPGTANESPADVELHAYEPPSNYYAGNTNSYGTGSSYAAPAKSSGYGASNSGYNSAASSSYGASAVSSYSAPRAQSSYGHQQQQQSSYSSPRVASVAYPKQQAAGYGQMRAYEPAAQYSASSLVPVYSKSGAKVAPVASAKRY